MRSRALRLTWKKIPVYTLDFEVPTLGNILAARVIEGQLTSHDSIVSGTAQMQKLVQWYIENDATSPIGFFQIGGGIAGDFAICAVPLIIQDLRKDIGLWWFAQISDSTTSFLVSSQMKSRGASCRNPAAIHD